MLILVQRDSCGDLSKRSRLVHHADALCAWAVANQGACGDEMGSPRPDRASLDQNIEQLTKQKTARAPGESFGRRGISFMDWITTSRRAAPLLCSSVWAFSEPNVYLPGIAGMDQLPPLVVWRVPRSGRY